MSNIVMLDESLQRKLKLKEFFLSSGFKIFKEELDQLLEGCELTIQDMLCAKIDDKKLADLNFKIGEREGIKKISYILDALEEELESKVAIGALNQKK